MIVKTELKKLKRSGYFLTFLSGALLAAAFPVINMAARSESYTALPGDPFHILLDACWQIMAMLNILLIVCGACMMYHTEYAENGIRKMESLPVYQGSLFFGKFVIAAAASALALLPEFLSAALCALHWFPGYRIDFKELTGYYGFGVLTLLPTIMLMLAIASFCRNMWISLGIGVILVFSLSIFPQNHPFFVLCPFCTPYRLLEPVLEEGSLALFIGVCAAEAVAFGIIECILIKIRRYFS